MLPSTALHQIPFLFLTGGTREDNSSFQTGRSVPGPTTVLSTFEANWHRTGNLGINSHFWTAGVWRLWSRGSGCSWEWLRSKHCPDAASPVYFQQCFRAHSSDPTELIPRWGPLALSRSGLYYVCLCSGRGICFQLQALRLIDKCFS